MPVDVRAIGHRNAPLRVGWAATDTLLYALGVGAGSEDPSAELDLTTENSAGVTHQALPTFAAVLGGLRLATFDHVLGDYDYTKVVHGGQGVELHRPLPVVGAVELVTSVTGIYDKGVHAVIALEATARLVDDEGRVGDLLFTTTSQIVERGGGGFGGERGPSVRAQLVPERAPDHVVAQAVPVDQALLYRLCGDRNPLHSDPVVAQRAGFPRPILHGLCTYGFVGRALLHAVHGSDVTTMAGMTGRFGEPVLPGDVLRTEVWEDDAGATFRTSVDDRVVLDGRSELRPRGA